MNEIDATEVVYKGQRYRRIVIKPQIRAVGTNGISESRCPTCGGPFTIETTLRKLWEPNRPCRRHPGAKSGWRSSANGRTAIAPDRCRARNRYNGDPCCRSGSLYLPRPMRVAPAR